MPLHGLSPMALEPEPSGLRRLLGRRSPENAYRKIHNLVATTPIRDGDGSPDRPMPRYKPYWYHVIPEARVPN
jgi:hypothetical protein